MREGLERAFEPRSVAVVGDKRDMGYFWLRSLGTFQGKVYSVQIDPAEFPGIEALGVENHLSLLDIPEPVDYVIVAVPREVAPRVVADCIRKGVGGVSLFTSGFAETDTEEGVGLQRVIAEMAREAGLNLIGPNCIGIFNPAVGLRHNLDQYWGEGGSVGFITQSGTIALMFSLVGALEGIRVSKAVSYGNAAVLDSADYLEYLAQDPETRIIAMYVEGVGEGRRFFHCLREAAAKKPVVLWKGGQTEEGARAAASHTGVLASPGAIWRALVEQCGIVGVDDLEETIDVAKALLYLKPAEGRRVGLVSMSGGHSVMVADAFSRAGLSVPPLDESSYRRLASFFSIIGGSYQNPFDISSAFFPVEDPLANLVLMLDILDGDRNIDCIALELSVPLLGGRWSGEALDDMLDRLVAFRDRSGKPFLVVLTVGHKEVEAGEVRGQLLERGLPCFPTFARAARALGKFLHYCRTHRAMAAA